MQYSFIRLKAIFYKTSCGVEPVREWLKRLSKENRKVVGEAIMTVQFGWPLGMPLVRSLGDKLWEVRASLGSGNCARILFFMDEGAMVLVNGFVKKSQKTPRYELLLALERKKIYLSENEVKYEQSA